MKVKFNLCLVEKTLDPSLELIDFRPTRPVNCWDNLTPCCELVRRGLAFPKGEIVSGPHIV